MKFSSWVFINNNIQALKRFLLCTLIFHGKIFVSLWPVDCYMTVYWQEVTAARSFWHIMFIKRLISQNLKHKESLRSYPSPGTSLSLSPSAWSWLEKLTNSAPSSASWGLFLRSFTTALRAARSSLLRSNSPFLLLRTDFAICFLDMLAVGVSVVLQSKCVSSHSSDLMFKSATDAHLETNQKIQSCSKWMIN